MAAVASQTMPSMIMVYLEVSLDIWVPVKVTEVSPTTVPCLGIIAVMAGVKEATYSIDSRVVSVSPVTSLALQV